MTCICFEKWKNTFATVGSRRPDSAAMRSAIRGLFSTFATEESHGLKPFSG
jgi:hypothetical protein